MLGILKVNSGISTNGEAEFSLTIADESEKVYDVQIDAVAYAQIVGVIEMSVGLNVEAHNQLPSSGLEVADKLDGIPLSSGEHHNVGGHTIDPIPDISLSDVGFDIDWNADLEDSDIGEDLGEASYEDEYVEPI